MKYILVLGIEFLKYKKNAKISISTDNLLVDEFDLDEDILGSKIKPVIMPDFLDVFGDKTFWLFSNDRTNSSKFLHSQPRFFKIYKLEDTLIGKKIVITVDNDNSNYNNGFMTKSSLIRFQVIAMFPESMIINDCRKLFDTAKKIREVSLKYGNSVRKKNLYGKTKCLLLNGPDRVNWPALRHYTPVFKNTKTNLTVLPDVPVCLSWLGGSFEIQLQVREKYNLKYLCDQKNKSYGVWNVATGIATLLSTSNILINKNNEDQ